ncbi:uncharacterized protein MELLADRAFT_124272 [Melampsora larici-populina 98AG31]|uniref:Secreted protein n=1 Tax=Melampsora larici-populina (strain 98AG31 / pathotype 3-4-7) TaxID=747676 RepID=F4R7U4_MELLP|nr:uncharacterized protein MELLADRAFT_124272 [Melampsora larici-populina 98AG31]EGG11375.1 secreted protein [Melampsora larici-populina 98AG31]
MIGVQLRRVVLSSLILVIVVTPTICELLDDVARLEAMGFSDTRRLRTSLEDGDDGRAAERHNCEQVECSDTGHCDDAGCRFDCDTGAGRCHEGGTQT